MLPGFSYHISHDVNVLKLGGWRAKKAQGQRGSTSAFCAHLYAAIDPQLALRSKSLAFLRRKKKKGESAEKRKVTSPQVETFLGVSSS